MGMTAPGSERKGRPFVSGLLLAAGVSSRFGSVKQLASLNGLPLIERAVRSLAGSEVDEVIVVLGHEAQMVRRGVSGTRARVVLNPSYASGLSSSLKAGVNALDARSEAAVIVLSDQPFVSSGLINAIVARFREKTPAAIAASSGELVTPPVLLSRALFPEVMKLEGDTGAKAVVVKQPGFERVEVPREDLLDIDTVFDLRTAERIVTSRARAGGGTSRGHPSSGRSSSRRRGRSHRSG